MASSGIERIDNKLGRNQFEGLLHPRDIKLSTAMAASAAAVDFNMGNYESKMEHLKSLQLLLGLVMGTSIVTAPKHETGYLSKVNQGPCRRTSAKKKRKSETPRPCEKKSRLRDRKKHMKNETS